MIIRIPSQSEFTNDKNVFGISNAFIFENTLFDFCEQKEVIGINEWSMGRAYDFYRFRTKYGSGLVSILCKTPIEDK